MAAGRACHRHPPCHKSTEQDPTRHEISVASFCKGTQCGLSACLHFKVHSSIDICLHLSVPSHPLEKPEGPWCSPYGTDEEVCPLVLGLPLSHSITLCKCQALEACFSIWIPKGKPSGQPALSLRRSGRSNEETFAKPLPHLFAEGRRVAIYIIKERDLNQRESWKLH